MSDSPLPLIIVLLAASVFVVTLARRLGLPSILGYVTVGLALGPYAFEVFPESETSHLLGELGVVFLLFTLGLEFSWPRMVAMRREVFGLGSLQVFGTTAVVAVIAHLFGIPWAQSIVLGGVVAMSSTVLIVQQLAERAELNRMAAWRSAWCSSRTLPWCPSWRWRPRWHPEPRRSTWRAS
jgi:CPA2 family monovalent cation:H+ antiporter-2